MFTRRDFLGRSAVAMAGGFNNQVVGGQSKLVRPAIQSPNYVPGVSGWTINKDGSAEFDDAVIRGQLIVETSGQAVLIYDGTPTAGNLVAAISPTNDVDPYGNTYNSGITIAGDNVHINNPQFTIKDKAGGQVIISVDKNSFATIVHGPGAGKTGGVSLEFGPNSGGLSIGNGMLGAYYIETVLLSAQVIPSTSAHTILVNLTGGTTNSDYGSAWDLVGGLWTAPVSGYYDFTMSAGFTGWAGSSRFILGAVKTSAVKYFMATDTLVSDATCLTLSANAIFMNKGDEVQFFIAQVSGAARTIETASGQASYITIRRSL